MCVCLFVFHTVNLSKNYVYALGFITEIDYS